MINVVNDRVLRTPRREIRYTTVEEVGKKCKMCSGVLEGLEIGSQCSDTGCALTAAPASSTTLIRNTHVTVQIGVSTG